jgi:chemotaxis protein CheD
MATCTAHKTADHTAVGIGQAIVASEPTLLTTILGSCIAVAMYSPHRRFGMLSHVVLPHSSGTTVYPAKFADTAVPYMLSTLKDHGVKTSEIVAKIAGGACMFGDGKFMQIGDANIRATTEALESAGIRISSQDVGGTLGRRICFNLATGLITVECIGHPSRTI